MDNEGNLELIPRTDILSGSIVTDGRRYYYMTPFDAPRIKFVTLVPILSHHFNKVGGPRALLDWLNPLSVDIMSLKLQYTLIHNEEQTIHPN